MKVTKTKTYQEILTYLNQEVRDSADVEDLNLTIHSIQSFLNRLNSVYKVVYDSLQDKLPKADQVSFEFNSYVYTTSSEVKRKFNNDFDNIEDEAKFLEDNGFPAFVSRTEETVTNTKVNRAQLKKAYDRNMLPEVIASHYRMDEEVKLKVNDPKLISKGGE